MDGPRVLIAVFSALCGLTLLVLAVRELARDSGIRKIRTSLLSVYGILFLGTSFLLWRAGDAPRERVDRIPTPLSSGTTARESAIDADSFPNPSDNPKGKSIFSQTQSASAVFDPFHAARQERANQSAYVQDYIDLDADDFTPKFRRNEGESETPEERVYEAVNRAFDAIEQWFFRYGSPSVRVHKPTHKQPAAQNVVLLPNVRFVEKTAEITAESAEDLRKLAEILRRNERSGIIEIQAQSDGVGTEPYQFILTQARAEMVRDFLLNEGVSNYQFIASAMNVESKDTTTAKSQIRFVFRR